MYGFICEKKTTATATFRKETVGLLEFTEGVINK